MDVSRYAPEQVLEIQKNLLKIKLDGLNADKEGYVRNVEKTIPNFLKFSHKKVYISGDKKLWEEIIVRALIVLGDLSIIGNTYNINPAYDNRKNNLYKYLEPCVSKILKRNYIS